MEIYQNTIMIRRGEIYYIYKSAESNGSEQVAGRPGIIVSNDANNRYSETVEVVYCTTQDKKKIPTHAYIQATGRESTVLCEQIVTVSKSRIGDYLGKCSGSEMEDIDRCLRISIGLDDATFDFAAVKVERDLYKKLYEDLVYPIAKLRYQEN